jgi:hypothetical protein
MKFIDAINNVDTSDTGKFHTPELQEVVVDLFGSEGWAGGLDHSKYYDESLVISWFINPHLCTDSWVGTSVIMFKGKPVGVADQPARKSDTTYTWIDNEDFKGFKEYLLSLKEEEELEYSFFTEEELQEDVGETFVLEFTDQLLVSKGKYGDHEVTVQREPSKDALNFKVRISFENNSQKVVDINDVEFYYLVNQNGEK